MAFPRWSLPPRNLALPAHEVHIWRANLDVDWSDLEVLRQTLSPDERARARRFHFPQHGRRFSAARGALRDILARYVRRGPARLRFRYSPFGKPALACGCGVDELNFNLSHCGNLALYAITRAGEVGVDLEMVNPELAGKLVAERFFSPQEVAALRALPRELQHEAFFNVWTRKEAYVKALGEGLRVPLDSFNVSLAPDAPADPLSGADSRWSLQSVRPARAYVGAVVTEGEHWCTRFWQWQRTDSIRGAG